MPYFNIAYKDHGYIAAVGWSGQWRADVFRPSGDGMFTFTAGMEDSNFGLHAGEKVTLPRMLMLRWEGTEQEGYNAYRRFAMEHIVPKIDGKPVKAPICFCAWGGTDPSPLIKDMNASEHLKNFEIIRKNRLNEVGEVYWIDAGWYGVDTKQIWWKNLGIADWKPNPELYPNGMEEIALGAKEAGLGFMLWYQNEWCRSDAERVRTHPDWYLGVRGKSNDLLLNLGNPQALEWMTDLLKDHIRRLNMKVLRVDHNEGPLPYWRYNDAEDRKGITEIKYMEGFYKLWDDLLQEFPGLIIDNCASGGRRLDYEALRRSIPLWRSDYFCRGKLIEAKAVQLQTYYIHHFVPVNGGYAQPERPMDTYMCRSGISSGIVINVPDRKSVV
jgi:alpha-galactosidase